MTTLISNLFGLSLDFARGCHIAPLVDLGTRLCTGVLGGDALGALAQTPHLHLLAGMLVLLEALHSLRRGGKHT